MGPLSVEKSNMLTKRTTKTEKFEKPLKTDNIKNFETIRYQLTALRNIIHSNLSDKLMKKTIFDFFDFRFSIFLKAI